LLATTALRFRDLQPQFIEIDLFKPGPQNFPVPNRSVQAKGNKQPATRIIIGQRTLQ
jgi:hypothetical protein